METNGRKNTTIQDIATEAKVSISTVSRVLNGNVPVREDKRQAVMDAVAMLKYRPNVFAQGLARGQSRTIGVLTQEISSPVYDAILREILVGLRGSGYSPLIADGHWQADREQKRIETLLGRQIDGLIVIGSTSDEAYLGQLADRVPLVVIGREIESLSSIYVRNSEGAVLATDHLIALGHTQIAHITGILTHADAVARCRGYKDALVQAGLDVNDDLIVEGGFSEQSGLMAVEMLFARGRPFTAIFAANDQMAYGARLALFRRGIRVPDDVSLVGFDDQQGSAYAIPPLTTLRQPMEQIGARAAEAVLQLIQGKDVERSGGVSAELIIRESTSRLRFR